MMIAMEMIALMVMTMSNNIFLQATVSQCLNCLAQGDLTISYPYPTLNTTADACRAGDANVPRYGQGDDANTRRTQDTIVIKCFFVVVIFFLVVVLIRGEQLIKISCRLPCVAPVNHGCSVTVNKVSTLYIFKGTGVQWTLSTRPFWLVLTQP